MLTRLYILLALLLSLLFTLLVALITAYRPANPTPIAIYHSSYPVITPANIDSLIPVVTLSRGATSNFENALSDPVWSPDGRYIAARYTGAEGGTLPTGVFLYDVTDFDRPPRLFEHEGILINHVFSPDSAWIATITHPGYAGGKMIVWDVHSVQPQFEFEGLSEVHFSPDRKLMASRSGGLLRVWDTQSLQEIVTLRNRCFDFDPIMVIVIGADCYSTPSALSLYDIESTQRVFVGEQEDSIQAADITSNVNLVATGDNRGTIKLWGLTSGALDTILFSGDYYLRDVPQVEFSPSGGVLASWTRQGDTIRLWSIETNTLIASLSGHSPPTADGPGGTYLYTLFSPDGKLVASSWPDNGATEDKNARLWDTTTGTLLRTLPDEFSATFSPDGTMLATDSADGTVKIWAVPVTF